MARIAEVALFTDRVDEMAAFYAAVLGVEPLQRGSDIAIFDADGITVLIHSRAATSPSRPPNQNHIALAVGDVDAACGTLASQGLVILLPPREYDWGRSAYLRDPDGHLVELQSGE